MKLNRRNALIGLGAVATGGGALFGSGAFSTVDANRTVSISQTGDASALLGLGPGDGATGIVGSEFNNTDGTADDSIITLSASSLNADATTTWNRAIQVTNNGDSTVNFQVVSATGVGSSAELDFIQDGGSSVVGSSVSIASGNSIYLDVTVDTTGTNDAADIPSSVTFQAQ